MRNRIVAAVASQAHEDWRKEYRAQNGDKPRIKRTLDESWTWCHGGCDEVDIAATAYNELPADWQRENKLGAEAAVDPILAAVAAGRQLDDAFVEEAAAKVHVKWLERNSSWASEEQKKPYAELPPGEQEKDRLFVRRAILAYEQLKG